jgi:hypothetical protein
MKTKNKEIDQPPSWQIVLFIAFFVSLIVFFFYWVWTYPEDILQERTIRFAEEQGWDIQNKR